jgi:hypothetical protein
MTVGGVRLLDWFACHESRPSFEVGSLCVLKGGTERVAWLSSALSVGGSPRCSERRGCTQK